MSRFYVVGELGQTGGCVFLGTLHREELSLSEVVRFSNEPIVENDSLHWNVPHWYEHIIEGLRSVGLYEEPVSGISCYSWGGGYLLFGADGALLTPTYHHDDPRTDGGVKKVMSSVSWETLFAETGVQRDRQNSIFQLGAEPGRRLKTVAHLLPIADGFNFLLSGVPRVEFSQASATQLFNPVTQNWSEPLVAALRLPAKILPGLVPAGTVLGPLRPELVQQTRLEEAQVIAACSHELAAALVGLPVEEGKHWGFMQPGESTIIGTPIPNPLINDVTRDIGFNNQMGYGRTIIFQKRTAGLRLLEQCQRFWQATDRSLDWDLLVHLAGSATPFESLIDPADERFRVPGDMPLKIQAFCKETHQPVPRKPGAVFRCILESLALLHRRTLQEIEYLAGVRFDRVYLLDNAANSLFHHFIANAIGLPVVLSSANLAALGCVLVQALALGDLKSLEEARAVAARSFKFSTLTPQSTAWSTAFERFLALTPARGESQPEVSKASDSQG